MSKENNIKLTKDQKDAIAKINDFIKNGSPDGWIVLSGKAGTGKTTTIARVVNRLKDKKVICGAISHKAKKVLESKIKSSNNDISFYTVAGMLNMQLNLETGKFEPTYSEMLVPPISMCDVILIDECSMIDEGALEIIMTMKKKRAKVVFLGDINQLPPIREQNENQTLSEEQIDAVSPTFMTNNIIYLKERLRQGEESPILPYSDIYYDAIDRNSMTLDLYRENIISETGSIYFTSTNDAIATSIKAFKKSIDTKNPELIKVICYMNNSRQDINKQIREAIYGISAGEFEVGEPLMMQDNFQIDSDEMMENSTEFQVVAIEPGECVIGDVYLKYYSITTSHQIYGKNVSIPVISADSLRDFEFLVKKKFAYARSITERGARKEAFRDAWAVSRRFAKVDYAYAITSHKSQGSTYKCAIVCETDIMQCRPTSWRTKLRSMYTAITRASDMCVIAL